MRYPVSFSQQRLWFLDQLEPGEPTYNMPYAMWLDGPLDTDALQAAMDALAARHAVLRTRIDAFDGVPEQIVADTATVPIELLDAPSKEDAELIAIDLARKPFDLATGPLIRAALIRAGAQTHLFFLLIHHIISDGESMKILIDDLSALYRAEVTGEPASLPTIWMGYGDYSVWQHDIMRGEELERLMAYWREQLRGAPRFLTLPTDRPRPAHLSPRGATARVTIDAATTRRLADVASGANATMFMVFLAGFVATLSRYARQTDLVTGTQTAGRTHTELDPIVGMFTNTVPIRVSMGDDPTFAELLRRIRDTTLDALSYQQVPFEKLVEEFAPERTLSYSPLIQTQFVYGSLTPPALDLPGITCEARALLTGTAKLDVTVYADSFADSDDDETTRLIMEYSTDLFEPAWADRFLGCMAHLLEHAAQAPGTMVSDLRLLSPEETEAVLRRGDNPSPQSGEIDILAVLQASTSRVIAGEQMVPMSQVCDRAARIAQTLADHGVGPETLVGLCLERGVDMLAALQGVWWAGGAYVPLDPGFPQARLAAMARGADLRYLICDGINRDLAQSITKDATVIDVEAAAAASPKKPVDVPENALAYVIFTSGSTGQPKGVGIEHRALSNLVTSFQRSLKLGGGDRFVAVTTLSFDIAILELLLPGLCGADLVIASADEAREPDRLRALIERTAATAMQATPQTWRLLDSAGGIPPELTLRLCGGEALPPELAGNLTAPGVTVWNVYGPTETTVWSAAGVVTHVEHAGQIGAPIDHTRIYVLDDHLRPVPVGVIGEVCLAGHGVARGYHDRPLLTARAFRPDPFSDEPGARMYRTGDLGRWLDKDGAGAALELIGRNDHQVKVRGSRIELGEIEAVLRAHRDVRQAVVTVADRAGEPALVAYVVPRRGSEAAQPDADLLDILRPHLRASLPDYMIPAHVMALPALPLTPNAKVDRGALPAPQWGALASTANHVAPRNDVEETLARIWSDLLATERPIGIHDNLFALGGHSLTATRFVARVVDTYGVTLPVHRVFSGPTIAELAEVIAADPDFGTAGSSSEHSELDALSDEELDKLLRAALAQRNRRQATTE